MTNSKEQLNIPWDFTKQTDDIAEDTKFYRANSGPAEAPFWVGTRRAESKIVTDEPEVGTYILTKYEVTAVWLTGNDNGELTVDGKNATSATLWSDDVDFWTFIRTVLSPELQDRLICDAVIKIVVAEFEKIMGDGENPGDVYEWVDETLNYLVYENGDGAIEWHDEDKHGSYDDYCETPDGKRYGRIHETCLEAICAETGVKA